MSNKCPVVTNEIKELHNKINTTYPEACKRAGFSEKMCAEWVGTYNSANNKDIDFIPEMTALINMIERDRNNSGESFLYIPEQVTYNLPGQKKQTYTIIGKRIFNKNHEEVYHADSENSKTHRLRIFANLAVQQGRAVVVEYKGHKYVVNNRNEIMSVATLKIMQLGNENGDRREVLRLAQIEFRKKEPTTTNVQSTNTPIQKAFEDNKKLSGSLDIIDEAIITGNWTDVASDELDNLNNEDYGKILKRFSQEELRGSNENLIQAETIIQRGERGTDRKDSQSDRERAEEQEQQLESWAKANGLWYNDYTEAKDGSLESVIEADGYSLSDRSGSESLVFFSDSDDAIKAIDGSHYGNIKGVLDKLVLHNSSFPETAMEVVGFGRDRSGTFRVIVKQKFIQGERPTTDDILEFIEKLDLKKKGGWYYTEDGKRFTDLNYGNIIKVGKTMFVIDCDIEFTSEYLNNVDGFNPNTFQQPAQQSQPSIATPAISQAEPQLPEEGFGGSFIDLMESLGKNQPQQESLKELSRPETPSLNSALKTPSNVQKDFYNAFSPAQITARAKMISMMFSDIIDDTILDRRDFFNGIINDSTASEEDKGRAQESLKVYNDPILARTAAVDFLTYGVIMDRIREDLSTQAEYATDDVIRQKLENTVTFFDQIANEAARWIDEEEGIRKGRDNSSDEEEHEESEFEDIEDESSDGNEGFVTKERLVNPFTRLSRQVKRVCGGIETGQYDDLGNSRTYSQGFIYSALMSYLSNNIENADDFITVTRTDDYEEGMQDMEGVEINSENYPYGYPQFPALEKMKNKYPWAQQVITRLVKDYRKPDEEDDDATQLRFPSTFGTLASQFYTNFRCAFIPYGRIIVGTTREGKPYDGVVPLNYDMEERSQLEELSDSYNNGITYSNTSIYNTDKTLNQENARILSKKLGDYIADVGGLQNLYYAHKDKIEEGYDLDKYFVDKTDDIIDIIKSFGINITDSNVAYLVTDTPNGAALRSMLADLKGIADAVVSMNPDSIKDKNYLTDLKDKWRGFFKGRGMVTETKMTQSFYDPATKKTRYSYSTDNYLQKTMRNLFGKNLSKEERQMYIDEHFGRYEWFRDQSASEGQGWKSLWLEYAYNDDNPRAALPYLNISSIEDTTGTTTTVHDYRNWTPDDIYRVIMRSWNTGSDDYAFYLSPIFADSPMSMTVRGPKYTLEQLVEGTYDTNGNYIESGFLRIVDQELRRIDYVTGARRAAIESGDVLPITNYEKRGAKFCIIPELNDRMFGPGGNMTLIEHLNAIRDEYEASDNKSAGTLEQALTEAKINAVERVLSNKYDEFFSGMPAGVKTELLEGKELNDENEKALRSSLILPYVNMVYANTQIVELTTVDTAFYKNSVDFQKRFKEVYASGRRPNTNSRYGKKSERVILVADEEVTSRNYNAIRKVIQKGVSEKRLKKSEADYILSSYAFLKDESSGINVSDAQALRSLSSFRSVLDMYGMWNDNLEESFQRITNGDWNMEDFNTVFQTLKPFVYSVIEKASGIGHEKIPVPVQHKNSELALLAMYDMISGGLRNSEKLKGINKFLEETKDSEGNPIGDMVQFESAGKSGNQGVVNINYSHSKVMGSVDTESVMLTDGKGIIENEVFFDGKKFKRNTRENSADNFDEIKSQLTDMLKAGKISQDTFNRIMDYYQPTAEEVQKILEDYTTLKDENGVVTGINPEAVQEVPFDDYMIVQPTPQHHMDTTAPQGSQGRNIIVADLPEDFKLSLDGRDRSSKEMGKKELIDFYYSLNVENLLQNYAELQRIFKDNRSLRDTVMDLAMSNPTYGRDFAEAFSLDGNGDFVLSPNSPTIFRKVQQLVNSVIKRRIAVQKVDGAALIQASGIGLSDELNLVFDENGKLAGAECYLPATSRKFYETLMKEVTINGKKVKVLDPKLLERAGLDKAIGYRIPTENKSSMLPIIIKGFAPQQNGSSIFLPAEITVLSGSDFDVDKMFVMLSSFSVSEYDKRKAREDFARTNAMFSSILDGFVKAGNIQELDEDEIEDIDNDAFRQWFADNKEKYRRKEPRIIKYNYDFSKSPKENGRKARNTMLVQIMHKILTSQEGSEAMFNPQNFSGVVEAAKMMSILSNPRLLRAYKTENGLDDDSTILTLLEDSKDRLVKFVKRHDAERAPIYPQTFEYFHHQNMTGDALLAMFALQVSAAAKFQRATISLKPEQVFTINGRKITNVDEVMNGLGEHRLKNVSQFVGACADNGKDPNLSDYGADRGNAKVIAYLLRAGLSIKEAALIVNQPLMRDNKTRWELAGNRKEWKDYPVTSEELAECIISPESSTKKIAILCSKVLEQAQALAELTSMSRADSPNGGLPETFAKARAYKHTVDKFNGRMNTKDFPFFPIQEALNNRKTDLSKSEDEIRESINRENMSMLQGFYSLGIQSFDTLLSPFFSMLGNKFDGLVVSPLLTNMDYNMSSVTQEELLTALYDDYITFALSGTPMFGNEGDTTMKEKRDYYLDQFPKDYVKILSENPDIKEAIGNIIVNVDNRLVHPNSAQLEKGQREEIMRRITSLVYLDNPVASQLVKDLFAYSYYMDGLQHTSRGYSTLLSTQFVESIDGYNDALKSLSDNLDGNVAERFMTQFVNNHPSMAVKIKLTRSDVNFGDTVTINRHKNNGINNPYYSKVYPYRYINVDDTLYILKDYNNDFATYARMPRFGRGNKLYNMNMDITQMASEFPYVESSNDASDPFGFDQFGDVDFGYGVYDAGQDDVYVDLDNDNSVQNSTDTPSDIYDNEGKGQLNNMCQLMYNR